ncbi:MAG: RNA ligase family protein [Planctomycetota bacterium]
MPTKPTGAKNYGSIPHLPNSRMGPADHACPDGMQRIATEKLRSKHDRVIVQEKLDGTNVGVAKLDGEIIALQRSGYPAATSPYEQHNHFAEWVERQHQRFDELLEEGERICGEWLLQAHGTRYKLEHEPFVAFDIMSGSKRSVYEEFLLRVTPLDFVTPYTVHQGGPFSVEAALETIGTYGHHGAQDQIEGAVWRVEVNRQVRPGQSDARKWVVDFVVKYVRPDKVNGGAPRAPGLWTMHQP